MRKRGKPVISCDGTGAFGADPGARETTKNKGGWLAKGAVFQPHVKMLSMSAAVGSGEGIHSYRGILNIPTGSRQTSRSGSRSGYRCTEQHVRMCLTGVTQ